MGIRYRRHRTEQKLQLVWGVGNICALPYLRTIIIRTIG